MLMNDEVQGFPIRYAHALHFSLVSFSKNCLFVSIKISSYALACCHGTVRNDTKKQSVSVKGTRGFLQLFCHYHKKIFCNMLYLEGRFEVIFHNDSQMAICSTRIKSEIAQNGQILSRIKAMFDMIWYVMVWYGMV